MKTSVKILLGFVLVIFMIPTVLFMAINFKAKGNINNRTAAREEVTWNRIDLGPTRFIKITSPDSEVLNCTLYPSDQSYYNRWPLGQGGNDSLDIRKSADTLFVNYVDVSEGDANNTIRYHRSLELFVDELQQIDVNGATVTMDSAFGHQKNDKKIIAENARINLGTPVEEETTETYIDGQKVESVVPVFNGAYPTFNNVFIQASKTKLIINSNVKIEKLVLDLKSSDLKVLDGASLLSVSGSVSADSYFNMNGANLAKLMNVVVK